MKKRGEKYGEPIMVGTIQKRRKTSQENSKKRKQLSKIIRNKIDKRALYLFKNGGNYE